MASQHGFKRFDPRRHVPGDFACGSSADEQALARYFNERAAIDSKNKIAAVTVMVDRSRRDHVVGYFALCAVSLLHHELPKAAGRGLPTRTPIPAFLLGRLAVDERFQGRGLGRVLLIEAMKQSCAAARKVAAAFLLVDPLNGKAQFYKNVGFRDGLFKKSERLFFKMSEIEAYLVSLAILEKEEVT